MTDVESVAGGQRVVWDRKKAALNLQKHGVEFEDAALVFADENRIERFDAKHSDNEDRWQVIGEVGEVLFVVYTERGDTFRLITARMATPAERRIYYAGRTNYL